MKQTSPEIKIVFRNMKNTYKAAHKFHRETKIINRRMKTNACCRRFPRWYISASFCRCEHLAKINNTIGPDAPMLGLARVRLRRAYAQVTPGLRQNRHVSSRHSDDPLACKTFVKIHGKTKTVDEIKKGTTHANRTHRATKNIDGRNEKIKNQGKWE